MNSAKEIYQANLVAESDIKMHLPYFCYLGHALPLGHILELGVRSGVSTSAFLAGLEMRNDGKLWSVDKNKDCGKLFDGHPCWQFICADSADVPKILDAGAPSLFDLVFLDTIHDYDTVFGELVAWGPMVEKGGAILVHDVVTFYNGAGRACEEFATEFGWNLAVRQESNGLAVMIREELREDT